MSLGVPLLKENITSGSSNGQIGLESFFELQDDIEEVTEATNGREGVEKALEKSRPDGVYDGYYARDERY